jgi:outer membrane protein
MKRIALLLTSLLLLIIKPAFTQQPPTFSLVQAQDYAVKNAYSIRNATWDVEISKKKVWEMTAMGLPQIKGSVSYQDMIDIPTSVMPDFLSQAVYGVLIKEGIVDPSKMPTGNDQFFAVKFGTQHNASAGISLSQLIFSGDYILGLQAAKVFKQMSEQSLAKSVVDIKQSVAKSYYLVQVTEENKHLVDSSLNLLDRTAFEIVQMHKQGFVDTTDVQQINLTRTSLKNTLSTLERQAELAKKLLKFQMGIEIEQPIMLTDPIYTIVDQANPNTLSGQQLDVNSNIDYTIINTAEKLAWLNVRRERYLYLPFFSASLSYDQKAMRSKFDFLDSKKDWFPSTILGFTLNVPIFNSGMKHSRVQQALFAFEKSRINKKQVEQGLLLEFSQSKSDFISSYEKYLALKDNMKLAEDIYKRTLIKYREGMVSSMELSQVQNQFLTVQSNYMNVMFELLNNKSKLDKILTKTN